MSQNLCRLLEEAQTDEELIDTLIAISVVAKAMARKLQKEHQSKGESR